MDFTIKNRIRHIIERYNIENTTTNFNKLAEVIHKKNIIIYQVNLNLISKYIIIYENNYCLKIEIEAEKKQKFVGRHTKIIFYKNS